MARSQYDNMDVDKPAKKDKKYSVGKITKHDRKDKAFKKVGKHKQQTTSDSSGDESSKASIDEGGAPLEGYQAGMEPIETSEGSLGKKQRKKEARLCAEALKILTEKALGPSVTASGLHIQAEKARKMQNIAGRKEQGRKGRLSKEQKLSKVMTSTAPGAVEGRGFFANDIMRIEPSSLQPPPGNEDDDVDMEDGGAPLQNKGSGYTAPPSGMNRMVRRRLKLIEREKAKIQKDLGVPAGSNEKADEVERRLDAWNKMFDEKAKVREAKKQDRKARQTARLQDKKRRRSTGGKL